MPTESAPRTVAQWFCLLGGAVLLIRGIVGFVLLDASFSLPGEGWHHLIHLFSGAVLLAVASRSRAAIAAALTFGLLYTAVAAIGIADGDDVLGVIAADTADKAFHTALGLIGVAAALASSGRRAAPVISDAFVP